MLIKGQLVTYDPDHSTQAGYELQIDDESIVFVLDQSRTFKLELDPDGDLQILIYRTGREDPQHLVHDVEGNIKVLSS